MPNVKLSQEKVIIIKNRLKRGEYHRVIAADFGVSRQTITKINKSLKEPYHQNARWSHINEFDTTIVKDSYFSKELKDLIRGLTNENAGSLVKSLVQKMECEG
jgi:hypothetical protein